MTIHILTIGDIVGKPGRKVLARNLPDLVQRESVDFCLANAENAAGGSGLTEGLAKELLDLGINVLTTGDHAWKKKEIIPTFENDPRVLRPANYSPKAAGRGSTVLKSRSGHKIGVINLLGRVFMNPAESPFHAIERELAEVRAQTPIVLVDFHAEATAEKIAMGWYLDGRVSAVIGTHTHVQTADAHVLPKGTAYVTDLGMTGPFESVLGRRTDRVLYHLTTDMPAPFDVAKGDPRINAAVVSVDTDTGLAVAIRTIEVRDES